MDNNSKLQNGSLDIYTLAYNNVKTAPQLQDIFCNSLKGKVALVTGGATGLGYTVVNRLAEAGASVVIASRNEERGKNAVKDFSEKGYNVSYVRTDVTKVADCYAAVEFAVNTYGKLDILVSGAAGWSSYAFLDMPEAEFDRIMDTDCKGVYYIAQAAARAMISGKNPGKIVFISSAAHLGCTQPNIGMMTHYIAAKSAVANMTKGIAAELKQYNISVNCVAPGGMLTAGVFTEGSEAGSLYGEEYLKSRKAHGGDTPLAMNPDMVALVVFAMCTPMSDFMYGETVNVNGGATLSYQEKPFSYTMEGCIPGPRK